MLTAHLGLENKPLPNDSHVVRGKSFSKQSIKASNKAFADLKKLQGRKQ